MPAAGMGGSVRPTKRNALMTQLLPLILIFGGVILGAILSQVSDWLALVGSLVQLAGSVFLVVSIWKMLGELKAITQNPSFSRWWMFIPLLNIYFFVVIVPNEMKRAKDQMGCQEPPRSVLVYFFIAAYALAADLNDLA